MGYIQTVEGDILSTRKEIPELSGAAAEARDHDGSHIEIIASAGSGKTETVSQRVARLVAEGTLPSEIVAFTFTKRAAEELKERIRERVLHFAGEDRANQLGNMYVGTIHGFCFQLLSRFVTKYETYQVVDENQFEAFVLRYANKLNAKQFGGGKLFTGIRRIIENVQVFENEMLDFEDLPEDFSAVLRNLYQYLENHKVLTYGLQINEAVKALEDPEVRAVIGGAIKHLIVDEYQDVNPAQERLIQLLAKPIGQADLVVVGDDDQAIYQWRGSTVANITTFASRYEGVAKLELLTNRRSRPAIVRLADTFAKSIPGRLEKTMEPARELNGPAVDIVMDYATEEEEAIDIADSIVKLVSKGYAYSDIAILVRASTSYKALIIALESRNIPIKPGGRLGLFEMPDADFLGRVFVWFANRDWKISRWSQEFESVTLESLIEKATSLYSLDAKGVANLKVLLEGLKKEVGTDTRRLSLVGFVYRIMQVVGVEKWDQALPVTSARLGTIARFAQFIADYEGMYRLSRLNDDGSGQVGASDQGEYFFSNLAGLLENSAKGSYKDHEGEDDIVLDAVDMLTVHAAKGLEWPIVFIPSLTAKRFPSSQNGKKNDWIIPRELFDAERYEGTDQDERRLFYVAVTRAREWVSLTAHQKVKTQTVAASPYIQEVKATFDEKLSYPEDWANGQVVISEDLLQITYSELAEYLNCGMSFWLRNRLGFPPEIVEAIGYGNAVHHLMRLIAEESTKRGRPLGESDVDRLLATEFFLPFAGKTLSENFRVSAKKIISKYLDEYGQELSHVWETERPFELAVPGAIISGRADVIIDKGIPGQESLSLLDYKTGVGDQDFSLQLQIYAEAGQREGLTIKDAYVHDMKDAERITVDITDSARQRAISIAAEAAAGIKNRDFEAKPSKSKCGMCDVRAICRSRAN